MGVGRRLRPRRGGADFPLAPGERRVVRPPGRAGPRGQGRAAPHPRRGQGSGAPPEARGGEGRARARGDCGRHLPPGGARPLHARGQRGGGRPRDLRRRAGRAPGLQRGAGAPALPGGRRRGVGAPGAGGHAPVRAALREFS